MARTRRRRRSRHASDLAARGAVYAIIRASDGQTWRRASSGASAISIALELDSALQAFLSAAPAPEASAPADAKPQGNTRIEELLRRGNLELLMDVELPVMLRFGCREATLREVLDMATGAVLELDREVHEPVDLVLNGRIIARGEVVVIDGDFGLRVSEVASPQQRVNSFTTA